QSILYHPDSVAVANLMQPATISRPPVAVVSAGRPRLSPLAKGGAVLMAGAGVWAATFSWVDEPLQHYAQSNRSTVVDKLSDVVQPLGRQHYLTPLAGMMIAGGVLWKDSRLEKAGLVSLGSILISSGVTSTMKNQFHRHRPSTTTENHIFDGSIREIDNTSLPSSHTATAFAVATSVATVYGDKYKYVPPLAYGLATLVGISRINDNAHWATDVMAGAAIGFFSAKGANYLFDRAHEKLHLRRQRLLLMPQAGMGARGMGATLVF
ncbi:phosphatase PAP2 family protein, partial [Pontibacter sp. HJ8]